MVPASGHRGGRLSGHRQRIVRVLHGVAPFGRRRYENRNSTTGGGKREAVSAPTFHFLLPASRHMTRPTKTWLMALGVFAAYLLVAVIVCLAFKLHPPPLRPLVIPLGILAVIIADDLL